MNSIFYDFNHNDSLLFMRSIGLALFLAVVMAGTGALLASCATPEQPLKPATEKRPVYVPKQPKSKAPGTATQKSYKVMGRWYHPVSQAAGFAQKGKASWYGKKFHGRKTANGERYDMYGLSAAHKTLPLGTYVRVDNLDNGRKLDVRLNDRGPFVQGRIIDLSYGAAKKLGVLGPGTANVKVTALGSRVATTQSTGSKKAAYQPVDWNKGRFTFQVGAFSDPNNAERYKSKLDSLYKNAHITSYFHPDHGKLYGVRIGLTTSYKQALEFKTALRQKGFTGAFTIAE
jgi:rare lipoprotein A